MRQILIFLGALLFVFSCSHTPRAWTNTEKAVAIASILAAGADAYTTMQVLDNPANWEVNPLMGKHPSNGKVIATMALTQVIFLSVAHYWEDVRIWLLGGKAVLNTGLAIHNKRLD